MYPYHHGGKIHPSVPPDFLDLFKTTNSDCACYKQSSGPICRY